MNTDENTTESLAADGGPVVEITREHYHVFPGTKATLCCLQFADGTAAYGMTDMIRPQEEARFHAKADAMWNRSHGAGVNTAVEGDAPEEAVQPAQPAEIVRVAHEVNRAYCRALGDYSQPTWDEAPEWQSASAVNGVLFHLQNPDVEPSASHEEWMAQKLRDGWTHGPEKDAEAKTHPCLVPFHQLPFEQQVKDWLFRAVVHALAGN